MSRKKKDKKKKVAGMVDRFIEGLLSGKMNVEEGERIVEQLQTLADDAVPYVVEMLASPDRENRLAALMLLGELGDPRAAPPLRRMLRQPDYSDEEKLKIIQTLGAIGSPIDEATFHRAISDPDALMRNSMEQMLATIEEPNYVEAFLEMMGESPPKMLEMYLRDMLSPLADRRLLLLLTTLLHSKHKAVIVAAVDAIERLKEPATISLLEERAQYDPSRQVRRAAENAALRLQVRVGVSSEGSLSFPWIVPSPLPLVHCLLCTMDGSGGQVILVAREHPDGNLQTLDFMFNDHEGIKDCFSIVLDEGELEEMVDSFGSVEFIDISLERARAEVARAYQVTLDAQRRLPPALMAWKGWLEGDDPRSVDEIPLPSLEPSRQAELLTECVELLTLPEFDFWFFNPDEVKPFMSRYRKLFRQGLAEEGDAEFEALLDRAIKSLVDEKYRRLIADRLRRQAWLLAQLYEDKDVPLWALTAAAALEEGIVIEHPFLREMMDYSFINAVTGDIGSIH